MIYIYTRVYMYINMLIDMTWYNMYIVDMFIDIHMSMVNLDRQYGKKCRLDNMVGRYPLLRRHRLN